MRVSELVTPAIFLIFSFIISFSLSNDMALILTKRSKTPYKACASSTPSTIFMLYTTLLQTNNVALNI
jgi:hypothetical protein